MRAYGRRHRRWSRRNPQPLLLAPDEPLLIVGLASIGRALFRYRSELAPVNAGLSLAIAGFVLQAPLRYLFGKRDEFLGRCWSDGSSESGEGGGESCGWRIVECDVVVAASKVLYEGVAGDDHLGCPIGLESAHRSQSALELAVIGLDRIVLVLLDMVPGRGEQLVEYAGVDDLSRAYATAVIDAVLSIEAADPRRIAGELRRPPWTVCRLLRLPRAESCRRPFRHSPS